MFSGSLEEIKKKAFTAIEELVLYHNAQSLELMQSIH